ncbi:MAG: hypothetical protein ACE1ZS_04210 [Candidatus Poribacteria bacterium]
MKKSISGVRGIIGVDLTLKDVLRFCNNFSALIKSKKCVVANDTRPSSDMISETAIASLLQNGIDVFNLKMSPTPIPADRQIGQRLILRPPHRLSLRRDRLRLRRRIRKFYFYWSRRHRL